MGEIERHEADNSRRGLLKRLGLASAALTISTFIGSRAFAQGEKKITANSAEAKSDNANEQTVENQIIMRAFKDEEFRKRLLADPRRAIAEVVGAEFPANIEVKVVEETPTMVYLVLPSAEPVSGRSSATKPDGVKGEAGLPFHSRWRCCYHDLTCTRKGRPAG